ncbi:TetR/AcrR family transcriptional regulator [Malonomonas rubra]|uniref:TetR/AcrR family transcriptional regulator n=1 Tax=Malonomonas rubra TaxID=57040 RepID=UPI0026ED6C97|nr:TetR/AcrR family transcriptional regulator [Malonomonas rubra]
MKTKQHSIAPRERILNTAAELFYHQGFRATGINEVISKSGVAKATFYSHFPTKDDLCLAYLKDRNISEFELVCAFVNDQTNPVERFLAVMKSLQPWLEANRLRGCAFLNMVAEVPDPRNRLRREGLQHYESLRTLIFDLAQDLINYNPHTYTNLTAKELADDYLVILGGAIAMAEIYHDIWPVKQGVKLIKRLINTR